MNDLNSEKISSAEMEDRLVPVLREGVNIVKMVLFKELRPYLAEKYSQKDKKEISLFSGMILNELFGTRNDAEPYASYRKKNKALIQKELQRLAAEFESLRIPLTDALRVQFLCDHQEGIDSTHILKHAEDIGLLMTERDVPLPKFFLNLVRRLGVAHGVLDAHSVLNIPDDEEAMQ